MYYLTSLAMLATISTVTADYTCPTMPNMNDMTALQYAYTIQEMLNQYYMGVPVNDTYFSGLPMANMTASNGMTLAENTVTNVEGLGKQAMLGSQALMMEMSSSGMSMPSMCSYMLPTAPNASAHLMNAFHLEASLCGAFIGLADYFQTPTLNSLSARLAAEHGIHASAIRAMMQPVGFMPNSTMLTPAFTPDMVLMTGDEVGMLGGYLDGCAKAPSAPCGGMVSFGDLVSSLMDQMNMSSCQASNMSASSSATATGSSPMATFTGGANRVSASAGVASTIFGLVWAFIL